MAVTDNERNGGRGAAISRTILAGLAVALILQALLAIRWGGQIEARVEGNERAIERLEAIARAAIATQERVEGLRAQVDQNRAAISARLDRIEAKLDRIGGYAPRGGR